MYPPKRQNPLILLLLSQGYGIYNYCIKEEGEGKGKEMKGKEKETWKKKGSSAVEFHIGLRSRRQCPIPAPWVVRGS